VKAERLNSPSTASVTQRQKRAPLRLMAASCTCRLRVRFPRHAAYLPRGQVPPTFRKPQV